MLSNGWPQVSKKDQDGTEEGAGRAHNPRRLSKALQGKGAGLPEEGLSEREGESMGRMGVAEGVG